MPVISRGLFDLQILIGQSDHLKRVDQSRFLSVYVCQPTTRDITPIQGEIWCNELYYLLCQTEYNLNAALAQLRVQRTTYLDPRSSQIPVASTPKLLPKHI